MQFTPPSIEQPLARAGQANDSVRQALDKLVADANTIGWGTDEIIVAIADNALELKEANVTDPNRRRPGNQRHPTTCEQVVTAKPSIRYQKPGGRKALLVDVMRMVQSNGETVTTVGGTVRQVSR